MAKTLPSSVTLIEKDDFKFIVMGAPSDSTLPLYLQELKKHGVKHVVRLCEPTYAPFLLEKEGITVHNMVFADGSPPPSHVIDAWLKLLQKREPIAVHCVAGLGRAPMLVAIALVEVCNMDTLSAIEYVRQRRPDAFNHRQINFLVTYKKHTGGCCEIM